MKILPTNEPPGLPESSRNGERAHEELEAPRLVGHAVARRPRSHVAQDDVVRARSARGPRSRATGRRPARTRRPAAGRHASGSRSTARSLPARPDLLRGVHRPAPRRRAEVEHAHPGPKQPRAPVDLLELEDAARREARVLRGAREAVGPRVGVLPGAHFDRTTNVACLWRSRSPANGLRCGSRSIPAVFRGTLGARWQARLVRRLLFRLRTLHLLARERACRR